jgi:hypothetical protein
LTIADCRLLEQKIESRKSKIENRNSALMGAGGWQCIDDSSLPIVDGWSRRSKLENRNSKIEWVMAVFSDRISGFDFRISTIENRQFRLWVFIVVC